MATNIYIAKRKLRTKARNGKSQYKLALRWKDPTTGEWQCEACGTSDRTEAESLRKLKWAEVNGLLPTPEPEPEPPPRRLRPSWDECRDAFERAMRADNMRPSYVESSKQAFNVLKRLLATVESPADVTEQMANEYKRKRSALGISPWSIRSDLAALKALFGKWLGRECGLLSFNPFAKVQAPKCDDPEIRLVTSAEAVTLVEWFGERWNNWRLPTLYLEAAAMLGWRAMEIGSLRTEDLLDDGFVRVAAATSKTRKHKIGWLPPDLHAELRGCCADGWAWGRFSDELRRLLMLWKRQPNHAASVRDFSPGRFVVWIQRELQRFNADQAAKAAKEDCKWQPLTLHDFRRTAISGLQMAGVSEKEASVMVGATPEVIRRHYERLDLQAIAKRSMQKRIGQTDSPIFARPLRAGKNEPLDGTQETTQTLTA